MLEAVTTQSGAASNETVAWHPSQVRETALPRFRSTNPKARSGFLHPFRTDDPARSARAPRRSVASWVRAAGAMPPLWRRLVALRTPTLSVDRLRHPLVVHSSSPIRLLWVARSDATSRPCKRRPPGIDGGRPRVTLHALGIPE